ncbi:hypothetical protein TNCV_2082101 [Trichonephila clavipes]|nr:hypothetical protein TNCV_2082101 [Trichonephila clavipes]
MFNLTPGRGFCETPEIIGFSLSIILFLMPGRDLVCEKVRGFLIPNTASGCLARGLAAPVCREDTIHLQTSTPSPGFEPRPYGTTISVTNLYTGWATEFFVLLG